MWETVKFGDVCEIQPKKAQVKKKLADTDTVSFMPMDDLGIDEMHPIANQMKTLAEAYSSYTYFEDNDVLLAKITPCFENGKLGIATNLANGVGFGSSEYIVLRCGEQVLPQYIYYHLNQPSFRANGKAQMSGAVGHKRVPKDFVENLEIPLPPLAEQQRIVSKLDAAFAEIDRAIELAQEQLSKTPSVFSQYLSNIAAPSLPLGDIVNIKTGKLNANVMEEDGVYPFFTCSREAYKINTYAFDCDAVLLAGNNAAGEFNVKHYEGKFNAYQRTYVLTVRDETVLRSRYLYFQLINALKQFKRLSVGAGTKFLKLGMIQGMHIPLPSLEEQEEVLRRLEALQSGTEAMKEVLSHKLNSLYALKAAILAQELQPPQSEAA